MALLKTLAEKLTKKGAAQPVVQEKATDRKKEPTKKERAGAYSSVLIQAHVTEKSTHGAAHSHYVFDVTPDANKTEVKKAVCAFTGITPVSVNIMRVKGKRVRFGKVRGVRKDTKKAIVTLPKGKTISLYEGV